MKKIIGLVALLVLLTGCSDKGIATLGNSENNNGNNVESNEGIDTNEEIKEEEKVITEFKAIGNVYSSTKNISDLDLDEIIYDDRGEMPYVQGEYKEVDFAKDLLVGYLSGNEDIFSNVVESFTKGEEVISISDEEKTRLIESTDFLRSQMGIGEGEPIYFKLDQVIYNGQVDEYGGTVLELRGFVSAYEGYFASISTFTINIYEDVDVLYGTIS